MPGATTIVVFDAIDGDGVLQLRDGRDVDDGASRRRERAGRHRGTGNRSCRRERNRDEDLDEPLGHGKPEAKPLPRRQTLTNPT